MFDEVHHLRNKSVGNDAATELSQRSSGTLCLTATPIITKLAVRTHARARGAFSDEMKQNLLHIGRIMKIPDCEAALLAGYEAEINTTLRKAQTADKQTLGETDADELKRARKKLFKGETSVTDPLAVSQYDQATLKIIDEIQGWFKNLIIRRTIWSRDPDGKPIWAADDPIEQILTLNLTPEEINIVNGEATESLEDKTLGWKKVRSSFARH